MIAVKLHIHFISLSSTINQSLLSHRDPQIPAINMSRSQTPLQQIQPVIQALIHTSKSGTKTTIPSIATDYGTWSAVLELIFNQEGLWSLVSGKEQRPAESSYEPFDDPPAAALEGIAHAFDKRNADALLLLYNYSGHLAERVLKEREGRTAAEMWILIGDWKDDVKLASGEWRVGE